MKLVSIIALIGSASAIKVNTIVKETPEEKGVPNTPGPLMALPRVNYTTYGHAGNKTAHKPWLAGPALITDPLNYTNRYGIGDRVQNFTYDTKGVPEDAKFQE